MAGGSADVSSSRNAAESHQLRGEAAADRRTGSPLAVWTASVPSPGSPSIHIFPDDHVHQHSNGHAASMSADAAATKCGSGTAAAGGATAAAATPAAAAYQRIKDIFHTGRHIIVTNLPQDVTEQEVRTFAVPTSEIPPIKSIVITPNAGGRRTAVCGLSNATARVFVTDPAGLDGFHPRTVNTNLGREHQSPTILALSLSPTDALLCVAHLPLSLGESEFRGLVDKFGPVKRAFIMRSRRTGESKGYGFVEYADKECAFAAKTWLDTKRREEAQVQARPRSLVTPTLSCDWLDCGIVTVAGLDSNCLCVAGLPRENPNMSELRTAMSVHVNPPYCQIALKQGSPQDYGLVEFETAEQAEITAELRHGAPFRNSKLSISYFIPGQRAINIYMKILHDHGAIRANAALLPDPTATSVAESMANMARNNPTFASNLTSIILNEIQDIQEGAFKTQEESSGNPDSGKWKGSRWGSHGNKQGQGFGKNHHHQYHNHHGDKSNNVDKPSDMFDGDQSVSDFTSNGTMFQEALAGPPIVAGGGWPRLGGAAPPPPPPAGNASEAFLNSLLEAAATSASHPPQRGLDGAGKPRNGTVGDFYAGTKLEQGKAPHQQQLLAVTGEAHHGFFPHQGFPGNPFPQYVILGDGKPNIELPLMAHHGSLPQQVASMEIDPYRGFSVVQPSWIPSVAAAGAPPPAAGLAGLHLAPAAALWPYAQMEPQMSVFAAAAAQNQLLGKRKLPAMPFGLPDHHHQQQQQHHHHHHQHQHHHQQQQQQHQQQQQQQQQQQSACFFPSQQYMIAAAAAAAQNDPYKRKRQY